ncbi:chitinase [Streptomyces sp. NPDC013455]|uniref:chitinase n=1 Tax=Streptomyces sp. NPDC013455 TaxID=3155605 RepID=UPI00340C4D20
MRSRLSPFAAFTCAFALAVTGCATEAGKTPGSADRSPARAAARTPAYAPYVSATDAAATDAAGSPSTYNLAFVVSDGSGCTPKWNGTEAVTGSAVTSRTSALKKGGAAVRVSFGGASGKELATTCDSASELAAAYAGALDAAGSDAADFDIEGDELTDSASVALRSRAIARLQAERPDLEVSFTLPVMPSGLDADALALLESANTYDVQVATVNLMTMNYGESYDGDMGDYAVASAKAAHGQLRKVFGSSDAGAWRGMALTSMIGVNDVAGETFTLADAAQVRAFAARKEIAWVSMWSAGRDRQCADGAERDGAATDCSGVRQGAGAFGQAFGG